jgi:heme-degrading monooxygenase HmoA
MVNEFETAFKTASTIIASMPGYISHELQRCLETTKPLYSTCALADVRRSHHWVSTIARVPTVAFLVASLL